MKVSLMVARWHAESTLSIASPIAVFIRQGTWISLVRKENSLFSSLLSIKSINKVVPFRNTLLCTPTQRGSRQRRSSGGKRALDNIMAAITSLKWPCFPSSVPFTSFHRIVLLCLLVSIHVWQHNLPFFKLINRPVFCYGFVTYFSLWRSILLI